MRDTDFVVAAEGLVAVFGRWVGIISGRGEVVTFNMDGEGVGGFDGFVYAFAVGAEEVGRGVAAIVHAAGGGDGNALLMVR